MNEARAMLTRRGVLRAMAGGGAMLAASAVAGCGSDEPPQATGNIVMIIRNGEESPGGPGRASLTGAGQARARALADLFSPPQRLPRSGLDRPAGIYACAPPDRQSVAVDTVAPLAQRLHLNASTEFDGHDASALVRRVTTQPGPTLICARGDEIPAIAQAFDPTNSTPPQTWPDARYDVVWVLTQTTDGWLFTQVPEQVLPGDQPSSI